MMCRWFRYGVLGRRMTESFSDGLVHHRKFWYDGQMVIYEESDGYKYRYYNGNLIDEVLCREDESVGQIWYLTDALGSVYVLTDNAANVVEAYHYSIYGSPRVYAPDGTPRGLTNYDNRILFTSREYAWQLGLYYYRFRWYCPSIGRFVSKERTGYHYCSCDPTNSWDPLGLQEEKKEEKEDEFGQWVFKGIDAKAIPEETIKRVGGWGACDVVVVISLTYTVEKNILCAKLVTLFMQGAYNIRQGAGWETVYHELVHLSEFKKAWELTKGYLIANFREGTWKGFLFSSKKQKFVEVKFHGITLTGSSQEELYKKAESRFSTWEAVFANTVNRSAWLYVRGNSALAKREKIDTWQDFMRWVKAEFAGLVQEVVPVCETEKWKKLNLQQRKKRLKELEERLKSHEELYKAEYFLKRREIRTRYAKLYLSIQREQK